MFGEWHNCQSYLLQLGHALIQELKSVSGMLPVRKEVQTFVRALDVKI